jgi:hypothetical protein
MPLSETSPKFQAMCKLEPRLLALFNEASVVKDDGEAEYFCGNAVWYGWEGHNGFKLRMENLVGHNAKRRELGTTVAYDVAYHTLFGLMPACRGVCSCM